MPKPKGRTWFLITAVLGLAIVVIATLIPIPGIKIRTKEYGGTGQAVRAALARLLPAKVGSARDKDLLIILDQLQKERYVAGIWLLDADGAVVAVRKGSAKPGQYAEKLARELPELIDALPAGTISPWQRTQLLAAGMVRWSGGGDHFDVFKPLIQPIYGAAGQPQAIIALAYDRNTGIGSPALSYMLLLMVAVAAFLSYWLGLPIWTYLDAKALGEPALLWGALVLVTNFVGLLTYFLVVVTPASRHKSK